jgi:hypothetical protein
VGFEPTHKGFADPCLTTWLRRHFLKTPPVPSGTGRIVESAERAMGFEPTTFSLARRRSTTELHPRTLGKDTVKGVGCQQWAASG